MMSSLPMPIISPAFTVDDIHKVREWLYEKRKGMSPQEICEDTHREAAGFIALLDRPADPVIQAEVKRRLDAVRI